MSEINLESWLFELDIEPDCDGHITLVNWLRQRNLNHLFHKDNKKIGYVIKTNKNGSKQLIARSSVPIKDAQVEYAIQTVTTALPITVVVVVPASKLVRAPKLKYEVAVNKRKGNYIRPCNESELIDLAAKTIEACGLSDLSEVVEIIETHPIEVHHKRQGLIVQELGAMVVVNGCIANTERFIDAWKHGIGSKRVYGFGMVRILGQGLNT